MQTSEHEPSKRNRTEHDAKQRAPRTDDAIESYREALGLDQKLTVARVNLGKALAEKGRLGEAKQELHKALELWGLRFFTRPLSLILIGLIVITIAYAVYRNIRPRAARRRETVAP